MTDYAQTAVENAFRLEAKKDRLAQRQSGDWTITFTVSPLDMPNGLLTAPMGTRFMLAAAEIADDETPVVQPGAAKATPELSETDKTARAQALADARQREQLERERNVAPDPHRLSRQAAMLCDQIRFRTFLHQAHNSTFRNARAKLENELVNEPKHSTIAAETVRMLCQVSSRAEFDSDKAAAKRWGELHGEYLRWQGVGQ